MYMPMEKDHKRNAIFHLNTDSSGIKRELWRKGGFLDKYWQLKPQEQTPVISWRHHRMETFSALLALCAGNSPVIGEFPAQRSVTRSFDVSLIYTLNKRLSKQSLGWWFEMPSCSFWRHRNVLFQIWIFSFKTIYLMLMSAIFPRPYCVKYWQSDDPTQPKVRLYLGPVTQQGPSWDIRLAWIMYPKIERLSR